jgi:hypothetical protein
MAKPDPELIYYSPDIKGDERNHNWAARFDFSNRYIGINQHSTEFNRVLLSPAQVKSPDCFCKRSGCKPKMKRSPLKRGNKPLARSSFKSKRKRLRPGKKTKRWNSVRAQLKQRFATVGITDCEFRFIEHDCWHESALSFAHSRKRTDPKFIIDEVALACLPAHTILDEKLSHTGMYLAVRKAIAAREAQP